MTDDTAQTLIDRTALRRTLARALAHAEGEALAHPLIERVDEDVVERLSTVLRTFERGVVLSPWPSSLAEDVSKLERVQSVEVFRTAAVGASGVDDEALPFERGSLDLFISTFGLQATNDLPGALIQSRLSLKPDGLFVGVLFAGQTLHELRTAFLQAESEYSGGAHPRVLPFADVRELGGLMQRAGFALPVADVDSVRLTFETPLHLLRELRAFGAINVLTARTRAFTPRRVLMRAMEIYAEQFSTEDGRVAATVELVTLTGWVPDASQQQPLKPGSATSRLADALGTAEHNLRTPDENA